MNYNKADAQNMFTRRSVIAGSLKTLFAASIFPAISNKSFTNRKSWRAINIMNFIRAVEPRVPVDMMQPVREQMALIKTHRFPATWLLQYDALVSGPFVEFLKAEMPPDHETGIWLEMNRAICADARIAWRGNPEWEWDFHVPVAYTIGYTPDERRRLADTAVASYRRIFGREVKTIASWNLDAITVAHLSDTYGIHAFANCRDQLATDGFTIWGAPIAAYYPNRVNAWSPAVEKENQISTPIFRLLGQDPVYYYDDQSRYPDTMEPAWPMGQSREFVDSFLNMISRGPTQSLAYAQLGQENNFGWPVVHAAYRMQMDELAKLHAAGSVIVETMGETGLRFQHDFASTPTQAQVMLEDPHGNTVEPERTVWYQSRFYRANLHFRGDRFYLRDLHVYDDRFPQPYLTDVARRHGIEQRLLAVLDGYHWSDDAVHEGRAGSRAVGRFAVIGEDGREAPFAMDGRPAVGESGSTLQTTVPLLHAGTLIVLFRERDITFKVIDTVSPQQLCLVFEWDAERSALDEVSPSRLHYRFRGFAYSAGIVNGVASRIADGVRVIAGRGRELCLQLAQIPRDKPGLVT